MSNVPSLGQALELFGLAYDILSGRLTDPLTIGRRLAGLALDFVPVDDLKGYLTDESQARAQAAADAFAAAKFGPR